MRLGITISLLAGIGCSASSGAPTMQVDVPDASQEAGIDGQGATGGAAATCRPSPQTSENLDPRVDVTTPPTSESTPSMSQRVVKTSDLFTRFNSICGGCHVSAANGGFHVSADTFATVFDYSRLARIESNDPTFAMPPEGKAFSSRPDNDPVRVLTTYLEPWLAQGRPVDMFLMTDSTPASGVGSYSYSAMTNLGDCVPGPAMYASSPSTEMSAKDTFFANATELPTDLADTDLTTLDTATLAANGLIAYRPTYPLWSDGSGKLRYIRVPKGTSIKFDKRTQTFDIPPNTRFYKTFFRQVIDKAGRVSHKKMETRLIVSRPDGVDTDGVTPLPQALYGTYVWSDDEMSARLRDSPYRDGSGFADLTETYITDEVAYQDLVDNIAPGAAPLANKIQAELLDPKHAGLVQRYAIPGSLRCVQCHRGSPTQDFILGFYPLQVAQRAASTGGVYEPVDSDELNQLQRFIDYGLITGMTSPGDVVPLESTQLPRNPRTPAELNAQAYMIGNCAHCHNPRGYPSLAKPQLATVLNFLPGTAADAGIFEFPFERMSPVRSRGANQDVPIPYITPSLRDYPVADETVTRVDNGAFLAPPNPTSPTITEVTWSPKYAATSSAEGGPMAKGCAALQSEGDPTYAQAYCGTRTTGHSFIPAPWRSIIYRNVDTPFPYFDDYVPFPHMPMNSAGFDCRAPRIMGSWMVGLPAVLKPEYQGLNEDTIPHDRRPNGTYLLDYIDGAQPYQEVKPGDDGYPAAVAAATRRLAEYQTGTRYEYCQDVLSTDIFDPVQSVGNEGTLIHESDKVFYPVTERFIYGGIPPNDPAHPGFYVQPAIGVPYHSEWFDYDPTEKSPWQPRRPTWESVIIGGIPDPSPPLDGVAVNGTTLTPTVIDARRRLTDALKGAQLSDALRSYATTEVPYGLWQNKPECAAKFASAFASGAIKKVSDFTGANRPAWMDRVQPPPSPDAPVYTMSPGAALYRHICINCHGPKADGKGLQSDALAASSEGQARPANLSGGLFGPPGDLGANLLRTFDQGTGDRRVADNWASHYMSWMTLGGTLQLIPHDVINQVEATKILGVPRQNLSKLGLTETVSANMLNIAKQLCAVVLPDPSDVNLRFQPGEFGDTAPPIYAPINDPTAPFVTSNGDWEMWMKLCSQLNRQLVRVYGIKNGGGGVAVAYLHSIYYADDGNSPPRYQYPGDGQVWDQNRQLRTNGVTPDNLYPSCFEPVPVAPGEPAIDGNLAPATVEALRNTMLNKFKMPVCDSGFLQHNELVMWAAYDLAHADAQLDNLREWALHGAINTGMSVFSYLEGTDRATNPLPPYYNECQLLP